MTVQLTGLSTARGGALVLALFTAAVFVSALLLFGVQPMFARMVLPELGGSPSVWSVAMVFFQSMLLAGYAYAHLLMQTRKRWVAVVIHIGVMLAALTMLPLSIAKGWGAPPSTGTADATARISSSSPLQWRTTSQPAAIAARERASIEPDKAPMEMSSLISRP